MEWSPALLNAIEKYLAGNCRPEEERWVNDWYHSFDDTEVIIPEQVAELRDKVGARMWRRLTDSIDEAEERMTERERPLISRTMMIAASLLFFLLGAGYLFLVRQRTEKAPAVAKVLANDVAPGGNKAILTLTNGASIVLDSAANGMLARQGNTKILKLKSGQLVYDVTSRAGDLQGPPSYNTITTPRGGQFQITLPDGTRVWLNAASSLRYPTRFTAKQRKVRLTGEAYFEVAKNAGKPFIVDMPGRANEDTMHIQVLGTSFNVNGYEEEGTTKTTLVEGSVRIVRRADATLLLPGQQAETDNGGGFSVNPHADVEEALAWKNGLFQFNSTNLRVIMRQISRWYDVDILYAGKTGDEFFSGSVPRTENVSQILRMLAMTNTVRFTIEGKTIRVEQVADGNK